MSGGQGPSDRPSRAAATRLALLSLGGLGLVMAHLPLLGFEPGSGRTGAIEEALYEPTSSSPGLVALCWLVMLIRRVPRLRSFEGRESPAVGSVLLLLGAAVCVWARFVRVEDLLILSLAITVLASGWLLGGAGAARTLAFPCAFLLLAIPLPTPLVNAVVYPLQLANATAAGFVIELFGGNPIVQGDLILFGERRFQVIEGCSGLRAVVITIMSACLYAEFVWHDRRRTALLIALAPAIAMLTNHLRILSIMVNPFGDISTVHTAQGLVMTVAAVILIASIDALLDRFSKTDREDPLRAETVAGRLPISVAGSFAVTALCLAVASHGLSPFRLPAGDLTPLVEVRADLPGWSLQGFAPDPEFLGTLRFDEFIAHRYERGGAPRVDVFVAGDARRDPTLGLGSDKSRIPGRGGVSIEVAAELGAPFPFIDAQVVGMPGELLLVYHWKVGVAGPGVETIRALFGLDRSPFRRTGRAAYVRLVTPVEGRDRTAIADAIGRLRTFLFALRPDFERVGAWPGRAG